MRKFLVAAVIASVVAPPFAQKLTVKIIDRQDNETTYTYIVPVGWLAIVGPYRVQGATLSLQLPDGQVAVVNCESKYAPHFDYVNQRSCRVPLVNDIQAEFDRDNAKLKWPVSVDGRTTESETYKVLAVLAKAPTTPAAVWTPQVYVDPIRTDDAPTPTAPSAAVARCGNGWYVYVSTGAKTCLGFGGVAEWFRR
jgi:hypothetical protein